jgi:hypothetical protein
VVVACSTPAARVPAPACTPIAARCDPAIADGPAILGAHCTTCHAAPQHRIVEMVTSCQMPPFGMPDRERQRLVDWASCR